jgi:hypothetical protein
MLSSADLSLYRREPFKEMAEYLERQDGRIRLNSTPFMRKRDVLRHVYEKPEARINSGYVLRYFYDSRNIVEP